MEDIYDSALNPLTGRGWWQKADDLWQCLMTCMEVYSVIKSGNPHEYDCALPVPQDGTCNGLQHYVALGGDHQGAKQVNLSAGDRPSDVYTFVSGMVAKILEEEAARGERFVKLLVGKVSRKVVKQIVMTTVYGVTFIGARDQIKKHLKDRKDLPEEECWLAAAYLAKKVPSNLIIGYLCLLTSLQDIQTWLNLCVRISDPGSPAEVNSLKQSSVFPPNFIHNLDATYMTLTAIECRVQGLTFASVHDSYRTHACSIDKMSEIIRHTSIELHSSDVLKKLHAANSVLLALASSQKPGQPSHGFGKPGHRVALAWAGPGFWLQISRAKPGHESHGLVGLFFTFLDLIPICVIELKLNHAESRRGAFGPHCSPPPWIIRATCQT
ncbi:hypothetical protein DFH09DRAFT_1101455 [Mycena vulgaris]|nr:hypothetical protein DFH09DRAFT_1101455 [Mycena vulgaris]